ncbi:MAG: HTH domain-containing protein [Anaerolineaceae bacterium]
MATPKRNYTQKTLKVLFALSGNQCAFPGCKNPVIVPPTVESDTLVLSQICHIYALNEDGPRGKAGLTESELNSPDNLILFCPTHHVIIDGQSETYPAELLKQWKMTHESKINKRRSADFESLQPDTLPHPYFPKELVDQTISDEVDLLRKSRFFAEFNIIRSSLTLARRLIEGELSGGSDQVRSRALAWCARFLSRSAELNKAEEFLRLAKTIGSNPEITIADAFIYSEKGDKNTALSLLADIEMPISRSASLMVVEHHEGPEGAIAWLKITGIDATDLDPDGKHVLLKLQLVLARWDAALELLDAVTYKDLREAPILNHMVAITHLLSTVPNEFRTNVLNQIPFEASGFPLSSDATSVNARREACRHFIEAAQVEQQLNLPGAAIIDDEYALWLELKDPDSSDKGRQRLEAKLRDPKSALRLVHLGLKFGITLDLEAVELEIERQIALKGGISYDTAIARLALAFTQNTPEDAANYITRHWEELVKYFDKKSLQFLQIEMLARAGLPERANKCLGILLEEGLSEVEERRLQLVIAGAEGTNLVEAQKEQFRATDTLGDLVILVDGLEASGAWDDLCHYGETLFERTRSLHDAERLSKALSKTQKNERLVEFLRSNHSLMAQSKNLQMLYCWSLYHEGKLLEARSELVKLSGHRDNPNYRALQINLGVALGDWNSLLAIVANECLEKDERSAQELIATAQLALHLGSPYAKELTFEASRKGADDAGVLTAAYFLATSAGWEDDAEVFEWLQKAAAMSDENGPIKKMSLKDILDLKPDWDRQESEVLQQLSRGEIPIFVAAQSLNKSLIHLMLFPALANLSENDPRRRGIIPAYSGKRQPMPFNLGGEAVLDATALLTLSFLDLLDKTLDAFHMVHMPHSTLTWLFEEKQKASFHQPSRIRDAHRVRNLLATGALNKLSPSTVPDSELSAQVGEELALLIAEAENTRGEDQTQRLVVRSSPVHRVASLMEEEADLTSHATVLSSCQAVVDKLRQKGQITAAEEKKARAYLQLVEKPWPNQPEIADGAILLLDDVAVSYFRHLGLLEKLQRAGFRSTVSLRKVSEINELISYERISGKVNDAIERIRSAINSRIESGKIKIGRQISNYKPTFHSICEHPTFGIISQPLQCDGIIADDRFINQHTNINYSGSKTAIFSTLDLIDALVSMGLITSEDQSEYRTLLRRAGYLFIPINEDELAGHLDVSEVKDNKIIETAELKAIRENILHVRMSTSLQLPKELPWLHTLIKVFIRVLKSLWKAGSDLSSIHARSDWIMNQIDVRGWAHNLSYKDGDNLVKLGRGAYLLMVLSPPTDSPQKLKDEYWIWIEDRVLSPIKEQYPDLYSWIFEWERRQFIEMVNIDLTEWLENDK